MDLDSFLVIHIGAGSHSLAKNDKYKKLIKQALQNESPQVLLDASKILERSPLTNTGYGSSLNLIGEVQCDASFICDRKNDEKISMGSMYNIDNRYPITEIMRCFEQLDDLYSREFKSFGLTKPLMFDYSEVQLLLQMLNRENIPNSESLISPRAKKIYDLYKDRLTGTYTSPQVVGNDVQDTIGLIHITGESTYVAASSGGNFFKFPGRIGCAGIIGASIGHMKSDSVSISCLCSGNGEDIIMMNLSNQIANRMLHSSSSEYCDALEDAIVQASANMPLTSVNDKNECIIYVGVICIIHHLATGVKHLVYCHSTESFYFGFRSSTMKPEVVLSRLDSTKVGQVFVRGEFRL